MPLLDSGMITLDEIIIERTILVFLWTEYLWDLFLSIRQYRKVSALSELPHNLRGVMTKDNFDKARDFASMRIVFKFVRDLYLVAISTVVVWFGILNMAWDYASSLLDREIFDYFKGNVDDEVIVSCVWLVILTTAYKIFEWPLNAHFTLVLKQRFNLHKQLGGFFISYKIMTFILSQAVTVVAAYVLTVTIKSGGEYFFVWLWLEVFMFTSVLPLMYLWTIAPFYCKYTLLPEGKLQTQIQTLAAEQKFPLSRVYEVKTSNRPNHYILYFYGMFWSKRIVICGTLLHTQRGVKGYSNEEILALLTHELGHWKFNHATKKLILTQVDWLIIIAVFTFFFKYEQFYRALGFHDDKPVLVGLFIVFQYVMKPYSLIWQFWIMFVSRQFEFQADSFAIKLGNKNKPLVSALTQLNKENLGFPDDDLYSFWYHSQPSFLERIEALKTK